MVKLFIGGFPLDMTELEIVQRVALYADVQTIKIVRDKKTKVCKGYAFLEVTDRAGAEQAMDALNGTQIAGRDLLLNIVEEDQPKKPASRPKFAPKTTFNTIEQKDVFRFIYEIGYGKYSRTVL